MKRGAMMTQTVLVIGGREISRRIETLIAEYSSEVSRRQILEVAGSWIHPDVTRRGGVSFASPASRR